MKCEACRKGAPVLTQEEIEELHPQVSDWEIGQLQGLLARSAVAWVLIIALLVVLL